MSNMDRVPPPVAATLPVTDVVMKQLPRGAVVGLFFYASVFALSYAKDFLVPIVLAYLLAMVFGPIRRLFDRRGVPSALTSLVNGRHRSNMTYEASSVAFPRPSPASSMLLGG